MEIIRGMTEQEYRARPERSQSDFKHFLKPTPAHAKHAMDEGGDESDNMLNGACLHALVLESKTIFEVDPKGKTQKNPAQHESGPALLSKHNAEIVRGMAAGIKRNAGAVRLLESVTEKELSVFWDGMKARLDAVCPIGIIDLKTTRGADLWQFSKSILDYGYHIQAAHYLEAAAVSGLPCEDFYIIAVENFPPFEAALYRIGHESLEIGQNELRELRSQYFKCLETGEYPGYSPEPVAIDLPAWKLREERDYDQR